MNTQKRVYDIDWLRVLGMAAIFLFHNARFFDDGGWHVKNFELDFGMSVFVQVLNYFVMPLFFVLSAIAINYALRKRSNTAFIRERAVRLLVPLGVGIFTHIMLQVYIENITQSRYTGTFWQFIPHYFDGWYGFGGNFAWMGLHLWYLLILFLFSGLMLGVFRWIDRSKAFTTKLANLAATGYGPFVFVIPLIVMEALMSLFPETVGRRDFGSWSLLTYLVFFLIGYLLATDIRYRPAIEKVRGISLALGVTALVTAYFMRVEIGLHGLHPLNVILRAAASWFWLMTFLGFASRHLQESNRFLKYANAAVLPFYILHQTVIVTVGFFIKDWQWEVFPKYVFLTGVSFILIMAIYEFGVRRVSSMQPLFGMKA